MNPPAEDRRRLSATRRFQFARVSDDSGFTGRLAKNLYESALKGETTDVELIFGEFETNAPKLHVHSAVLKMESKVFNVWMSETWSSEFVKTADGKTLISLREDDHDDFKMFIKLLYGYQNFDMSEDCYDVAIPAYRLADKYEAVDVMNFCNLYFYSLTRNLEHVNVAKVMLLAQKYLLELVYEAGVEFVKAHPMIIMEKYPLDWAKLDPDFIMKVLSTNNLKVPEVNDRDWSWNERILCQIALRWLTNKQRSLVENSEAESDSETPAAKRRRMDTSLAVQVLQNIRFTDMNPEDLKESLQKLVGFLTPSQIGTIYLVCSGTPQMKLATLYGDEDSFIVDPRKRQETDPSVKIERNEVENDVPNVEVRANAGENLPNAQPGQVAANAGRNQPADAQQNQPPNAHQNQPANVQQNQQLQLNAQQNRPPNAHQNQRANAPPHVLNAARRMEELLRRHDGRQVRVQMVQLGNLQEEIRLQLRRIQQRRENQR